MTTFKFSQNSDSYGRCFEVEVDEKTLDTMRAGQQIEVTVRGKVEEVEERRVRDYGDTGGEPCCVPMPMNGKAAPPKFKIKRMIRIEMSEIDLPGGKGVVNMGKNDGKYADMISEDDGE